DPLPADVLGGTLEEVEKLENGGRQLIAADEEQDLHPVGGRLRATDGGGRQPLQILGAERLGAPPPGPHRIGHEPAGRHPPPAHGGPGGRGGPPPGPRASPASPGPRPAAPPPPAASRSSTPGIAPRSRTGIWSRSSMTPRMRRARTATSRSGSRAAS